MQEIQIIKRNGAEVDFDPQKIATAISKANNEVPRSARISKNLINAIADDIKTDCEEDYTGPIDIETIQDMVESYLIKYGAAVVAKTYIKYRYKREAARNIKATFFDAIGEKLRAENVQNQNANVDEHSFSGRIGEASSIMTRKYALDYLISDMAKKNHEDNIIYIHDLDHYAVGDHNCLSIPFDDLLSKGFRTRQTDVRPANSINTAMQLVAVIFQLQSLQQFGGCSATHLDWTMVPYVRKSFMKHYMVAHLKNSKEFLALDLMGMLASNYTDEVGIIRNKFDEWLDENKHQFFKNVGLEKEDFTFANKDKLDPVLYQSALYDTIMEVHQAVEGMYHNLNTLQSRSGGQLPFTSINFGTCTSEEGRLVTRTLLNVSLEGLGSLHKTSIFPCGIFQCMKGINRKPGDPNYDLFRLALKSTAQRLYPNYANVDWTTDVSAHEQDVAMKNGILNNLSPENYNKIYQWCTKNKKDADKLGINARSNEKIEVSKKQVPQEIFSTMGCRTSNGLDVNFCEFEKHINEIIQNGTISEVRHYSAAQKDGRGNICPTTIILPTVAMMAKEMIPYAEEHQELVIASFMDLLTQKLYEARDMLLERFNWICSQDASGARFMYENGLMVGYEPEEGIRSALKHGTLALGQLGLAEALQILVGCDHTEPKGMELAKKIEQLFKDKVAEFKKECHLNFGVYYTPAENLCYTSMKKFKQKYGVIANVSDKDYFTNSIHVPVWKQMTPFEKIDIEGQLTGYSSAGCITYVELESTCKNNIDALETIVNYAMDHDIPYFAINVPNDMCMSCGCTDEINDKCPICGGENIQRLRRVTGLSNNR